MDTKFFYLFIDYGNSIIAYLDLFSYYFVTEYNQGILSTYRYYAPFSLGGLSTFQNRWANPYYAYYYELNQTNSTSIGYEVVFTDGVNVLYPSANITMVSFPDQSTLYTDLNGNTFYAPAWYSNPEGSIGGLSVDTFSFNVSSPSGFNQFAQLLPSNIQQQFTNDSECAYYTTVYLD